MSQEQADERNSLSGPERERQHSAWEESIGESRVPRKPRLSRLRELLVVATAFLTLVILLYIATILVDLVRAVLSGGG